MVYLTGIGILSLGIIALIVIFYWFWLTKNRFGQPKIFNDFMMDLLKYKEVFEQTNFYTELEADFRNRKLPSFDLEGFKAFVGTNLKISSEEQKKLFATYSLLKSYESKLKMTSGDYSGKFRAYLPITKKVHITLLVICCISAAVYGTVDRMKLNEYKAMGIGSADERYVHEEKEIITNGEITEKLYRSGVFGGNYFTFKVKFDEPITETVTFEVDPFMYQVKRVGDSLKVEIHYSRKIDRYTNKENIKITDVRVKE